MFGNMIEPKLFSRNLWNDLTYQSTGTLKFPGLGPPPTCPFIDYYNVKEPTKSADNDFSRYRYRGEPLLQILTTNTVGPMRAASC